jgi:hypothetical protein
MNRATIEQYVAGGQQLRAAYEGLTWEQLFAYPIANTWSLHQIAVHIMDSDLIGGDRMKRIACMVQRTLTSLTQLTFFVAIEYWSRRFCQSSPMPIFNVLGFTPRRAR